MEAVCVSKTSVCLKETTWRNIPDGCHLEDSCFKLGPVINFIFTVAFVFGLALGPTQLSVQWVSGGPFPGAKARPGRNAHHSPQSSAEVKNEQEL
jgi:hypothetical protein